MDFLCRKSARKKEAGQRGIQGVLEGGKGLKLMSFYPGFGGGISNVQCGMILTHGGGFGTPNRGYLARRVQFRGYFPVLERCVGSVAWPWRS